MSCYFDSSLNRCSCERSLGIVVSFDFHLRCHGNQVNRLCKSLSCFSIRSSLTPHSSFNTGGCTLGRNRTSALSVPTARHDGTTSAHMSGECTSEKTCMATPSPLGLCSWLRRTVMITSTHCPPTISQSVRYRVHSSSSSSPHLSHSRQSPPLSQPSHSPLPHSHSLLGHYNSWPGISLSKVGLLLFVAQALVCLLVSCSERLLHPHGKL